MSSELFPLDALAARVISREVYAPVTVDTSVSGKEARSSWSSTPRYRYQLGVDVVRSDVRFDFARFLSHFTRHFAQLDSFLIQDAEDYTVTDHGFGVGDAATVAFQLQRSLLGSKSEMGTGGPYATSSKPRTNLALQSQTLDNASWTKTRSSISANAAIAPDGTLTADKLVEDATATSTHLALQAITIVSGTTYTVSIYAKASTRTKLTINVASEACVASFDLTAATATLWSGVDAEITSVGNGWYRCEVAFTSVSSTARNVEIYLDGGTPPGGAYSGDGTSGLFLWGAQVEAASSSTKYIPTTTAAVVSPSSAADIAAFYWPGYLGGFEPVRDPDPASVLIYVAGVLKTLTTDYTVSSTGVVTFVSAPAAAAALSWTGTYYRRVRYAGQGMAMQKLGSRMWALPTVDLVSVL